MDFYFGFSSGPHSYNNLLFGKFFLKNHLNTVRYVSMNGINYLFLGGFFFIIVTRLFEFLTYRK